MRKLKRCDALRFAFGRERVPLTVNHILRTIFNISHLFDARVSLKFFLPNFTCPCSGLKDFFRFTKHYPMSFHLLFPSFLLPKRLRLSAAAKFTSFIDDLQRWKTTNNVHTASARKIPIFQFTSVNRFCSEYILVHALHCNNRDRKNPDDRYATL